VCGSGGGSGCGDGGDDNDFLCAEVEGLIWFKFVLLQMASRGLNRVYRVVELIEGGMWGEEKQARHMSKSTSQSKKKVW
jgi:hypothetical protein